MLSVGLSIICIALPQVVRTDSQPPLILSQLYETGDGNYHNIPKQGVLSLLQMHRQSRDVFYQALPYPFLYSFLGNPFHKDGSQLVFAAQHELNEDDVEGDGGTQDCEEDYLDYDPVGESSNTGT